MKLNDKVPGGRSGWSAKMVWPRPAILIAALAIGDGGLLPGIAADAPHTVLAGQEIIQPFGACKSGSGEILLTEPKLLAVLGLDPQTGYFRIVSTGGLLGVPAGIAAEQGGTVLVANGHALIRLDPQTGAQGYACSGGFFRSPVGVAIAADGLIYVVDATGMVIRVDPSSGSQKIISSGGVFIRPQGIAVRGSELYVADVADRTGSAGVGRVIQVDMVAGRQRIISQGGYLAGPVSLAVENNRQVLVGDPYSIGVTPDQLEPAIIRVDPETGAQTFVGKGTLASNSFSSGTAMAVHFQIIRRTVVTQGSGAPTSSSYSSGNGIRGSVSPLFAGGAHGAAAPGRH
jgi:hypothetical protein